MSATNQSRPIPELASQLCRPLRFAFFNSPKNSQAEHLNDYCHTLVKRVHFAAGGHILPDSWNLKKGIFDIIFN